MTPLDPPREPRVTPERLAGLIRGMKEGRGFYGDTTTVQWLALDLIDARAQLAEVSAERDAARLERDERKAWQAVEAEALLERVRRREKQAEQYRIALHKIVHEPICEPEDSDARVYDIIVEIAQAALAESSPPQPQEDPK